MKQRIYNPYFVRSLILFSVMITSSVTYAEKTPKEKLMEALSQKPKPVAYFHEHLDALAESPELAQDPDVELLLTRLYINAVPDMERTLPEDFIVMPSQRDEWPQIGRLKDRLIAIFRENKLSVEATDRLAAFFMERQRYATAREIEYEPPSGSHPWVPTPDIGFGVFDEHKWLLTSGAPDSKVLGELAGEYHRLSGPLTRKATPREQHCVESLKD